MFFWQQVSAPAASHADRSRDCVKAHQSAIEVTKAIAAALRKAKEARAKDSGDNRANASSPSTTPGQRADAPSDEQGNKRHTSESTPSSATPVGAGRGEDAAAAPSATTGNTPGASSAGGNSDGSTPVVAAGQKKGGDDEENGGRRARPVLTLVQHLCVSAPERAEGRARVAEGLAALLPELEESDRARFVSFLAKVCRFSFFLLCVSTICLCDRCAFWCRRVDA